MEADGGKLTQSDLGAEGDAAGSRPQSPGESQGSGSQGARRLESAGGEISRTRSSSTSGRSRSVSIVSGRGEGPRKAQSQSSKGSGRKNLISGARRPIQRQNSSVSASGDGESSDRPPRPRSRSGSIVSGSGRSGAASRVSGTTVLNRQRFHKKKLKIATRLNAQRELEAFRKENGARLGGEWVDQKWVPKHMLQEQDPDEFVLAKWFKELGLYLLFLMVFTWLIYSGISNEELIGFERVWRSTVYARFENVSSPETVLDGLDGLFLEDFVGSASFTNDSFPINSENGYVFGSILIGEIRVRQLRTASTACTRVYEKLITQGVALQRKCYPMWDPLQEEKGYAKEDAFVSPSWAGLPQYDYISSAASTDSPYIGKFGQYHGGGFVAAFTVPQAGEVMTQIRDLRWIDTKTRLLVVDFNFFNVDINMFLHVRLGFEYLGSGIVIQNIKVDAIALERMRVAGVSDLIRVAAMCWIYMMVTYYIFEDLEFCRKHGLRKYRSFGWGYVDLANVLLFTLLGFWKISNLILYELAIPSDSSDVAMLNNVHELGRSYYLEDQINGLNGMLLWIKLFKYAGITRRLMRLGKVVSRSMDDIYTYAFLFSVVLFAYAVLGYLLFGTVDEGYLTIDQSCTTLLKSVYADLDFEGISTSAGTLGYCYLLIWLIVSNVILLNMVVAILSTAYRETQDEEAVDPSETIWDKFKVEFEKRRDEAKRMAAIAREETGEDKEDEQKTPLLEKMILWVQNHFLALLEKAKGQGQQEVEEEEDEGGSSDSSDADNDFAASKAGSDGGTEEGPGSTMWKPWPSRVAPAPPPVNAEMI